MLLGTRGKRLGHHHARGRWRGRRGTRPGVDRPCRGSTSGRIHPRETRLCWRCRGLGAGTSLSGCPRASEPAQVSSLRASRHQRAPGPGLPPSSPEVVAAPSAEPRTSGPAARCSRGSAAARRPTRTAELSVEEIAACRTPTQRCPRRWCEPESEAGVRRCRRNRRRYARACPLL